MRLYTALGIIALVIAEPVAALGSIDPCPLIGDGLPCWGDATDIVIGVSFANGAKVAFVGLLFAMMVFYGFKLIMGADNESTVSETYSSYAHAAIGAILAGGAFALATTFATPGTLVAPAAGNNVLFNAIITFKALLAAGLIFNICYQAYRLITSQDESQNEKAKKQFIYGMVGAVIVILADVTVAAFLGKNIGIINVEAIGIANFLGTILGAFSFIAIIAAGIFLVISVDEQYKDRAKKIIITALIVLGVTMAAYALVRFAFNAPQ